MRKRARRPPAELAAWTARWAAFADTAEALAGALERIGEAGAASLTEVFDGRTAERQTAAITARANLQTGLRDVRERLTALRAERDAIAAENDDAPPASDLRPASREGRPGAPLWRLIRFADGLDEARAAAVEGALYGAGLLTAWVHPDPALTQEALAASEADGYLLPGAPVAGRTLADVLVPEDAGDVAPAVVAAVLRSIALTDDLTAATASPGDQCEGSVHVRCTRRSPPERGPGIHRHDQPGQPSPRPARRARRAHRADRRRRGAAGRRAGPGRGAA